MQSTELTVGIFANADSYPTTVIQHLNSLGYHVSFVENKLEMQQCVVVIVDSLLVTRDGVTPSTLLDILDTLVEEHIDVLLHMRANTNVDTFASLISGQTHQNDEGYLTLLDTLNFSGVHTDRSPIQFLAQHVHAEVSANRRLRLGRKRILAFPFEGILPKKSRVTGIDTGTKVLKLSRNESAIFTKLIRSMDQVVNFEVLRALIKQDDEKRQSTSALHVNIHRIRAKLARRKQEPEYTIVTYKYMGYLLEKSRQR